MRTVSKLFFMKSLGFLAVIILIIISIQYYCFYKPRIHDDFLNVKTVNGYNDGNFERVRRGMTLDELKDILGEPLFTINKNNGDVILVYTDRLNPGLEYSARELWMHDGKVKQWYAAVVPYGLTPWGYHR